MIGDLTGMPIVINEHLGDASGLAWMLITNDEIVWHRDGVTTVIEKPDHRWLISFQTVPCLYVANEATLDMVVEQLARQHAAQAEDPRSPRPDPTPAQIDAQRVIDDLTEMRRLRWDGIGLNGELER